MPNEKIAETYVDNGSPEDSWTHVLRIRWGAKGGAPEAPDGWVNAGYAHLQVSRETEQTGDANYVELDAAHMDHLIRTLKKIRRQTFDA